MESLRVYIECDNLTPGEVMGTGNPMAPSETSVGSGDTFSSREPIKKTKKKKVKSLSTSLEESVLSNSSRKNMNDAALSEYIKKICQDKKYWMQAEQLIFEYKSQDSALHITYDDKPHTRSIQCMDWDEFSKEMNKLGVNKYVFHWDKFIDLWGVSELKNIQIECQPIHKNSNPQLQLSIYSSTALWDNVKISGCYILSVGCSNGKKQIDLKNVKISQVHGVDFTDLYKVQIDKTCQIETNVCHYWFSPKSLSPYVDVFSKAKIEANYNKLIATHKNIGVAKALQSIVQVLDIPTPQVKFHNLVISYGKDKLIAFHDRASKLMGQRSHPASQYVPWPGDWYVQEYRDLGLWKSTLRYDI